jgi:hypothetical protein
LGAKKLDEMIDLRGRFDLASEYLLELVDEEQVASGVLPRAFPQGVGQQRCCGPKPPILVLKTG